MNIFLFKFSIFLSAIYGMQYSYAIFRCFLKFDKLIVDDNAYIYNDMEGRVEKLPHKVI